MVRRRRGRSKTLLPVQDCFYCIDCMSAPFWPGVLLCPPHHQSAVCFLSLHLSSLLPCASSFFAFPPRSCLLLSGDALLQTASCLRCSRTNIVPARRQRYFTGHRICSTGPISPQLACSCNRSAQKTK